MIFPLPSLPVLTREPRVQARRPWTAWLRVVITLLANHVNLHDEKWRQLFLKYGSLELYEKLLRAAS